MEKGKKRNANVVASFDAAHIIAFSLTLYHPKLMACRFFTELLVTSYSLYSLYKPT